MTTNWQPSVLASFLMAVSARLVSFRQPASFMTTSWRPTRRCGGISHLGGRSQAGVHQAARVLHDSKLASIKPVYRH